MSSAAIATTSIHKDYLGVTPVKTDTTPLLFNAIFNDKTSNNNIISTLKNTQGTLNETERLSLSQQDKQTPENFVYEELSTTTQQKIPLLI